MVVSGVILRATFGSTVDCDSLYLMVVSGTIYKAIFGSAVSCMVHI